MQLQIIGIALIYMKPEAAPCYRSVENDLNNSGSAVVIWAFLVMKLFESAAERHEKEVLELLYCGSSNAEAIRIKLKSMTSCSGLVREGSVQMI